MATQLDLRPSPIAGQWYPADPRALRSTIESLLADAAVAPPPGEIVGLVAPHAGYRYSGPVAAQAFKLVAGRHYEHVVVLSPMHHPYSAPLLTTAHDGYATPLGSVPVAQDVIAELAARVPLAAVREDPEHSLEIELPFLQVALDGAFTLTPLMLRDQSQSAVQRLGDALAAVFGGVENVLLVASSDLSHFYTDREARTLDRVMLDRVAAFDPAGVLRAEAEQKAFACGRGAIAAMLIAARGLGADAVEIVGYGTSGDTSGDRQRVVGYGAAAVTRTGADGG